MEARDVEAGFVGLGLVGCCNCRILVPGAGPKNPEASAKSVGVGWGVAILCYLAAVSEMRWVNRAFNRVRELRASIAQ